MRKSLYRVFFAVPATFMLLLVLTGSVTVLLSPATAMAKSRVQVAERTTSVEPAILGATRTGVLVWLAQALGYLDGLPIEVKLYQSGTQTARDLVSGEIQFATSSHFAFVSLALDAPQLRMIATLSSSRTAKLLSRRDTVQDSVTDLRQKKIGVTRKSIGEFFLWEYLFINGVGMRDVTLVDLSPLEIVDRLANGELDAALTWEPHVTSAAKKLNNLARYYPDQFDQYYYFSLGASADWLEKNPEIATKVVAALVQAEEYARKNPDNAQRVIASLYDMPITDVQRLWSEHTLRVELPLDLISVMENSAKWRIEEGLTDQPSVPNMLDFIDTQALDNSKASAVQIIK